MKTLPGVTAVLLGLALAGCSPQAPATETPAAPAAGQGPAKSPAATKGGGKGAKFEYETVCPNPDAEVPDGFRGDVHPALFGQGALELAAHWKPTLLEAKRHGIKLGVIDGTSAPEYSIPDDIVALLTESTPVRPSASYGAHELSAFLPQELGEPGQMWKIDLVQAEALLQQFHAGTSMHFDRYRQPYGRRPGPPGAFGILRAITPETIDVLFRVHAEFVLSEGAVLYTPACFLGRMLIDRQRGTVESFQMRVPTDRPVNVNLTVTFKLPDQPKNKVTNIVFEHVETMELVGGDLARLAQPDPPGALTLEAAHDELKRDFYKFMDIAWVPAEEMLSLAQAQHKPIFMVVLTSPLDDQSC